jgi:hypothetical protein
MFKRFVYNNSNESGLGFSINVIPDSSKILVAMTEKYQELFLSDMYH